MQLHRSEAKIKKSAELIELTANFFAAGGKIAYKTAADNAMARTAQPHGFVIDRATQDIRDTAQGHAGKRAPTPIDGRAMQRARMTNEVNDTRARKRTG